LVRREALFVFSKEGIGMARISLRQLLDHAAEHSYGVPAFNIANMEQALAVMDAASVCNAPVIVQASRRAQLRQRHHLRHMVDALTEIHPQIPLCVHLDWQRTGRLPDRHSGRLHLRDDGRLAQSGRWRTGTTTSRSPRP
jgi:fructose/tagatose bisphosphate aldolase